MPVSYSKQVWTCKEASSGSSQLIKSIVKLIGLILQVFSHSCAGSCALSYAFSLELPKCSTILNDFYETCIRLHQKHAVGLYLDWMSAGLRDRHLSVWPNLVEFWQNFHRTSLMANVFRLQDQPFDWLLQLVWPSELEHPRSSDGFHAPLHFDLIVLAECCVQPRLLLSERICQAFLTEVDIREIVPTMIIISNLPHGMGQMLQVPRTSLSRYSCIVAVAYVLIVRGPRLGSINHPSKIRKNEAWATAAEKQSFHFQSWRRDHWPHTQNERCLTLKSADIGHTQNATESFSSWPFGRTAPKTQDKISSSKFTSHYVVVLHVETCGLPHGPAWIGIEEWRLSQLHSFKTGPAN